MVFFSFFVRFPECGISQQNDLFHTFFLLTGRFPVFRLDYTQDYGTIQAPLKPQKDEVASYDLSDHFEAASFCSFRKNKVPF